MSIQLPELPEPKEPQKFFCNKCGQVGTGDGMTHNRRDGSLCGYAAPSHGPFFSAEQMREYGKASAIAAMDRCAQVAVEWGNARLDDHGGHALRNYAEAIHAEINEVTK